MSNTNPRVSIIVRTQNRPKQLKQAIKSIAQQYYHHIEVILVNDGGDEPDIEALKKILKNKALIYLFNEQSQGRSNAANLALENISGDYFAFLDDDDELLPHHVSTLIKFLQNSDYLIAYSDVNEYRKIFNRKTNQYEFSLLHKYSKDFNFNELLLYNYIPFNALLFHQSVVKKERLDSYLDLYEDWDFLIRLAKKYPFYHLPEMTAHYYKWDELNQINNSQNEALMLKNQNVVIGRYQHWIPTGFIRQLWLNILGIRQAGAEGIPLEALIEEYNQFKQGDYMNQIKEQMSLISRCKTEKELLQQETENQLHRAKHLYEVKLNESKAQLEYDCQVKEIEICNQRDSVIHEKNLQLLQLEQSLNERDSIIHDRNLHIIQLEQSMQNLSNESTAGINQLKTEIHHINISLSWRILSRLRRLLEVLFPQNSIRRRIYLSLRSKIGK